MEAFELVRVLVNRTPEAKRGYTSRGPLKGFKPHVAVNQERLLLKTLVTLRDRYDSSFLPDLIQSLTPNLVVADAGYDSKDNREAARKAGAEPVITDNPRRKGKQRLNLFSKEKQYSVEQFYDFFKNQMLQGCWKRRLEEENWSSMRRPHKSPNQQPQSSHNWRIQLKKGEPILELATRTNEIVSSLQSLYSAA